MTPNVRWLTVSAGTKRKTCAGLSLGGKCCRPIYVVPDPDREDRYVAVDCDVPDGSVPSIAKDAQRRQNDLFGFTPEVHDGRGVKHECPDAELIRREWARRHANDIPARKRA